MTETAQLRQEVEAMGLAGRPWDLRHSCDPRRSLVKCEISTCLELDCIDVAHRGACEALPLRTKNVTQGALLPVGLAARCFVKFLTQILQLSRIAGASHGA